MSKNKHTRDEPTRPSVEYPADAADPDAAARSSMTAAAVSVPGTSLPALDVEYPADAADPDAAAVEAYKAKAGIWSLPAPAHVSRPNPG